MTDLYAVMGDPIEHSLSPTIHHMFAEHTGQDLVYEKRHVIPDDFSRAVGSFFDEGGKGLSITVPHKQSAFKLASRLSARARLAGAVNTLLLDDDDKLFGDNTDGVGLIRDLCDNHQLRLKNTRILLLGASGAARGVIGPLLETDLAHLHIANRTESRAEQLLSVFQSKRLSAGGLSDIEGCFDIIINATAASLGGVPPAIDEGLYRNAFCYDMMYAKAPTAFMQQAMTHGATMAVDGLGMLLEQAAEAFFLWRGVRPETQPVFAKLSHG